MASPDINTEAIPFDKMADFFRKSLT